MKTIIDLVESSIRIYDGMLVCWPQFNKRDTLSVSELIPKFPGCYATNNSTVAFIWNDSFYVAPYTRLAISILKDSGLQNSSFYVPFSNWDYPVNEETLWKKIKAEAEVQNDEEHAEDCAKYCDEHGFGKISDEALVNCLRIPDDGVRTRHLGHGYESVVYPVIAGCLDCNACDAIGTFNTNNGKVVFIYRNGATYVTKGYGIVKELEAAGYTKSSKLFVPLSNGEEIEDPYLRAKWDSIK